jgi:hypothetical protein
MSRKQQLLAALKRGTDMPWRSAALKALAGQNVVSSDEGPLDGSVASEWLQIYRLRLKHCQEIGVEIIGLAEFVEALEQRIPNELIRAELFGGGRTTITAFWDVAENLVGCITNTDWRPGRGQESLDLALGKR